MLGFKVHLLLIIVNVNFVFAQLRTNFVLKNLTFCPSDGPIKYSGYATTENQKQYLYLHIDSPIPLDSNIRGIYYIETVVTEKQTVPIFEIHEKDFCKSLNKYLGEFWYGMQRAAQIPVGVCPIPPGRYHVHHYYMDFSKITLQTFPFGTLKFTFHGIDKQKNQLIYCLIMEVENVLN